MNKNMKILLIGNIILGILILLGIIGIPLILMENAGTDIGPASAFFGIYNAFFTGLGGVIILIIAIVALNIIIIILEKKNK